MDCNFYLVLFEGTIMKKTNGRSKKYYGYQTELAINNFPFDSYPRVDLDFIYAIGDIKEAAAIGHKAAGEMKAEIANAIFKACRELRAGEFNSQFMLPGLQGGAGTSIHMNVNEVIAGRATEIIYKNGGKVKVESNDDVNLGQSTNDVLPSALKIASIRHVLHFLKTLDLVADAFGKKANEFKDIPKLGRTHLQDAVPTTLGEVFKSYRDTIERGRTRLAGVLPYLYDLNLGGTAIGNSVNASVKFIKEDYIALRKVTGISNLAPAKNLMSQTSGQSDFLMLAQTLTSITLDFSKIANDLRLLSSGPSGGIAEIKLKGLQPGSSIMPGKVNPVMPETVNQLYFLVSGNGLAVEHAVHGAQLELGVMVPVMADRIMSSLKISDEVICAFVNQCVIHIEADEQRCRELLEKSTAYATALTPILGYEKVSAMVKEAKHRGANFADLLKKNGVEIENGIHNVN